MSSATMKRGRKILSFSKGAPSPEDRPGESVVLDVGGKIFRTTTETLKHLPNTRLGRMCVEGKLDQEKNGIVFFDRNPQVMNSILDLYRTGELHLSSNICYSVVEEELRYFDIPIELVSACCRRHFENNRNERTVVNEMQKFLQGAYPHVTSAKWPLSWRMKLWCMLERPRHSTASKVWSVIFFVFVFLAIISFIFETDRSFREPTEMFRRSYLEPMNTTLSKAYYTLSPVHFMAVTVPKEWLHNLRFITFAFFLTDFLLRLATCPDRKQ